MSPPAGPDPTRGLPDTDAGGKPPRVLFVCVKNGGKSQMAAGLMNLRGRGAVEARSAGTSPGRAINQLSAQSLAEVGVDITAEVPKPVTAAAIHEADLIVTLGREAHVDTGDTPWENWDTDEPSERGIDGMERMRLVRDDVDARVQDLLTRLLRTR